MTIAEALDAALAGKRLLDHPFYRRWEAGELAAEELAAYAEQYRHVEAALPGTLEAIAGDLPEGAARGLVGATLDDELGHPYLFESFAAAVGARPTREAPATDATSALVELPSGARDATDRLAMVAVYEVQAADIARTKGAGLRRHYRIDAPGTAFWDVHADIEGRHATWSQEALVAAGAEPVAVRHAARAAALAWWSFLDDREGAA